MSEESYTERRAASPNDSWGRAKAASMYHVLFAGGAGALLLGVPVYRLMPTFGPISGLVGFVLGVALLIALQKRKTKKLAAKSAEFQKQLHDLKQQEFELRFSEAEARGLIRKTEGKGT